MDHKGTLLVVDDNPVNLMLLAGALKADDYQVLPADSGEMALTSVSACLPELILLGKRLHFAHTRPRGRITHYLAVKENISEPRPPWVFDAKGFVPHCMKSFLP